MPKKVIFLDIDGVLADLTHRLHYIKFKPKDYDKFFAEAIHDVPMKRSDYIENLYADSEIDTTIVFLTGRPVKIKKDTLAWLDNYYYLSHRFQFLMRGDKDHRKSPELKAELALKYCKKHNTKEVLVIDDMEDNLEAITEALEKEGIIVNCWKDDRAVWQN